jgi:hypothetical protein
MSEIDSSDGAPPATTELLEADYTSQDVQDLRARQQAVLLAYGRRPAAETDAFSLMCDAVSLVAETLRVELYAVVEPRPDGGWRLTTSAVDEDDAGLEGAYDYAPGEPSMASAAVEAGQAVLSPDLALESRFEDAYLRGLGFGSAATLPLCVGERIFGCLGLYGREPREFTTDDAAFAETLAHLLTASIARLQAEGRAAVAEKEAARLKQALAGLLSKLKSTTPGDTATQSSDSAQPLADRESGSADQPFAEVAAPKKTGKTLRESARRSYRFRQKMAPVLNGMLPDRDRLAEVPFRDISAGGASFVLDKQPSFNAVVIELGLGKNVSHVAAEIVRVEPIAVDGRTVYVIGCKFTGRVHL